MFRAKAGATPLDDDDDDDNDGVENAAASVHNAHWLTGAAASDGGGKGEASNFVGYYDAASLYPSSSKYKRSPGARGN